MRVTGSAALRTGVSGAAMVAIVIACLGLNGCQLLSRGTILYDREGIQIGFQPDPSVTRVSPPALNTHPIEMTTEHVVLLLSAVRVSGWSGTLVGYFETPRQIPLFDDTELRLVAAPIAEAFRRAGPKDRVFFFLPNPKSAYGDATAGSLFIRDSYLHVVVTDHKAFAKADTAGGDEKDVRDTKGMKLWVVTPYKPADVPPSKEPDWAPFETVHVSLSPSAILARNGAPPVEAGSKASAVDQAGATTGEPAAIADSPQDLKLQIRELTQSNLDLRDRLNEQTRQLHELREELTRLQRELGRSKPKSPPARKPSAP